MNDDQEKTQLLQKIAHATDDYTDVCDDIDSLAHAGKMEVLYQAALALEEDADTLLHSIQQQWTREEYADSLRQWTSMGIGQQQLAKGTVAAIFDHIEAVISSIPGLPSVETLLKLSEIQREASVQVPLSNSARLAGLRVLASRLANAQEFSVLLDVFERHSAEEEWREFLSYLLQEMVVCGEHLDNIAVIQHFHHLLQEQQHPLAWLPLMLTSIETDIFVPKYSAGDGAYPFVPTYLASNGPFPLPIDNGIPLVSTIETQEARFVFAERSNDARRERIRTAVLNWEEESNGRSEVRIFVAYPPLVEAISPQVLLSLPLTCLEETRFTDMVVQEISPNQAFVHLFSAASNGGAYNAGHQGARGRLEAWQSISGLVGVDEQASYEQVLDQALKCQWYSFEAKNTWFYSVAWDLGLIAVQADRTSLAVLAATDTD